MKKILILSDSLALPREKPECCSYDNTWPQLLRATGKYEIHQVSLGGATISDLHRQLTYHKLFDPDIVVVQSGIVDCAPRFASRFEIDFIKRIPLLGFRILSLLNNSVVRKRRNKTYTNINSFGKIAKQIEDSFPKAIVLFIGIAPTTSQYENILPHITINTLKFNKILKNSVKNYIGIEDMPKECLMSDHHHLNKMGHRFVFQRISNFV